MIKVVSNKEQTAAGPLPITFNSDGAPLDDYNLYGTSDGAGAQTESGEPTGYKLPMTVTSEEETENKFDKDEYLNAYKPNVIINEYGNEVGSTVNGYSTYKINVIPEQTYTLKGQTSAAYTYFSRIYWLGSNDEFLGRSNSFENVAPNSIFTFTTPQNCYKIEMQFSGGLDFSSVMLTKGSTPPDHYIPYRYSTTTPIYIGDTKLGAEEYVDYEEQKIYRLGGNLADWSKTTSFRMNKVINQDDSVVLSTTTTWASIQFSTAYDFGQDTLGLQRGHRYKVSFNVAQANYSSSNTTNVCCIRWTSNNQLKYVDSQPLYITGHHEFVFDYDEALYISFIIANANVANPSVTISDFQVMEISATDPPVPLPEISTYSGENTLSCSEELGDESQITYVGPVEETITKIMRTEDDGQGNVTEHVLYKEGS